MMEAATFGEAGVLRIAIVDDTEADAAQLEGLLARYFSPASPGSEAAACSVTRFASGDALLTAHAGDLDQTFDLLFLDIEMPGDNGMRLAGRIRTAGSRVALIFTTRVARLASLGYDVEALGYLLKPVQYPQFVLAMRRAQDHVAAAHANKDVRLTIDADGQTRYVSSCDILYVEVNRHRLIYHLADGDLETWGSLKDVSQRLAMAPFVAVNRYALGNLEAVSQFAGSTVTLENGDELQVSLARKTDVAAALAEHYGGE